jgi:hypothetical protein
VELTGQVSEVVGSHGASKVIVLLVGAKKDPKDPVGTYPTCYLLPAYCTRGLYLSPGQAVKVTGEVKFVDSSSMFLANCTLEELGKSEILQIRAEDLVKEITKDGKAAKLKYEDQSMIVSGQLDGWTEEPLLALAKLKGDGKVRVSVTLGRDELPYLKKGRTVRLRGTCFHAAIRNNEVVLDMGFIVEAK